MYKKNTLNRIIHYHLNVHTNALRRKIIPLNLRRYAAEWHGAVAVT